MKVAAAMDKDYIVDASCIGCGICKEVCPVKNIKMVDKKSQFKHG
jgi:Pyruvate/2-oxoacid:ferredoxin oxidoreductase delta subunit